LTVPTTPLLLLALLVVREPLLLALLVVREPLLLALLVGRALLLLAVERELLLRARLAGDAFERDELPLFALDPELLVERLLV
jgi:hypothetical protein